MDDIDDMFKTLERELEKPFSAENTRQLWGDSVGSSEAELTIKTEDRPVPMPTPPRVTGEDSRIIATSYTSADGSVNLTIHIDGSASMSMPGANVSITPRRATSAGGAEYEIGDVIGRGGMGVINVARQASLDRRIVVKTIRPELAQKMEAQEKFITEALATGSLDHPNVVPIHDMGVGEDGNLFYVMKEVKGRNWREAMSALSEAENIDILQRVSDAVACAHDRGIIHRDLKPENVMIGDYGEVLLMDWGLAAAITPAAKAAHLSNSNACAGTPSFMAPEMARGMANELGPWSDQYLLGAILFHILTGKSPHPGKSAEEGLLNAANNVIVKTDRNDEWMNVALRAMATTPHKRYPSVKAFQKALRNCQVHGESILLTTQGEDLFARAEENDSYDEYARSIYAYEQALNLWQRNLPAAEKLTHARLAYAERAFERGDYELTMSLLADSEGEEERDLAERAEEERDEREARRRRVKVLGRIAAGALLLVAVTAGVASVLISRQADAERMARAEAEQQRSVAQQQRSIALQEREAAERQRGIAETQRGIAEEQRGKAEEALLVAETARRAEAEAKDNQLREQEAKLAAEERARLEAENARQRAEEALRAREEIQRLGYLEDNSRWRFDADEAVARQRTAAEESGLELRKTVEVPGASFEFALIPSGYYVMGSPPRDPSRNNDEYLHEVDLSRPFHLGVTEVTRRQWQAVVGVEKIEDLGLELGDEAVTNVIWRLRQAPDSEAGLPASGVSYNDIVHIFLPALKRLRPGLEFRLPSEAEWEWAARAGATGHYYTGDTEKSLDACAWYEVNSQGKAQPTGGKEPNAWGIHDILGNVAELTLDAYDSLYYLRAPRIDPANLAPEAMFRVCRGGSYINSPRLCRMSARNYMHVENRYPHAGFRLALGGGGFNQ